MKTQQKLLEEVRDEDTTETAVPNRPNLYLC
jgi:hypothetical protein